MDNILLITVISLLINVFIVGYYIVPILYTKYMIRKEIEAERARLQLKKDIERIVNNYLKRLSK